MTQPTDFFIVYDAPFWTSISNKMFEIGKADQVPLWFDTLKNRCYVTWTLKTS